MTRAAPTVPPRCSPSSLGQRAYHLFFGELVEYPASGATIKFTGTSMHVSMQQALLLMMLACWFYVFAVTLMRVRSIILERERKHQWVAELEEVKL